MHGKVGKGDGGGRERSGGQAGGRFILFSRSFPFRGGIGRAWLKRVREQCWTGGDAEPESPRDELLGG